jgi:hypothetical protein
MQLLYSTYFQVSPRSDETVIGAFERISNLIRAWIDESYRRRELPVKIPVGDGFIEPLSGHLLTIRTQGPLVDGAIQTRFMWRHADIQEVEMFWYANAAVSMAQGIVEFSITVSRAASSFRSAPKALFIGRPRIVRDLLAAERCSINNLPLGGSPVIVKEPEVDDFVEDSLCSANRALPILLISPEGESPFCIAPESLADKLAGLCTVVVLETRSATFRLTDLVGRELSCFNGACRLYWPGFSLRSNPWQHPLFLADAVRRSEQERSRFHGEIINMVSSALSLRAPQGPITRQVSFAFAKTRREEIDGIKSRYEKGLADQKEFEAVLKLVEEERDSYKEDSEKVRNRLDLVLNELETKTQELEEVRKNWKLYEAYEKGSQESETLQQEGEEAVFSSVGEAVQVAVGEFPNNLEFLESAIESAADCPFRNPARVYKVMQAIDEVAEIWRKSLETKKSMGGGLVEIFKIKGIEFKKEISQTSRAKFEEDYTFIYNGRKQLFEQHITEGAGNPNSCFSVHMLFDRDARKVIVAHVGKHLPNTSS